MRLRTRQAIKGAERRRQPLHPLLAAQANRAQLDTVPKVTPVYRIATEWKSPEARMKSEFLLNPTARRRRRVARSVRAGFGH
jgi:hypothetical protein